MYIHSSSSRTLFSLFLSVALFQFVLAVVPCPDGYHVVNSGGQCVCQHGNDPTSDQPVNCPWTITNGQCSVTCPSGTSGGGSRRRRQEPQLLHNEDGSISNCPRGMTSCPITDTPGSRHECVNTKSDLDNCGGCAATGRGVECGKARGVRTASCDGGLCYIHSCRSGYRLDMHEQECVARH